jgi:serine/threonine protein kinase
MVKLAPPPAPPPPGPLASVDTKPEHRQEASGQRREPHVTRARTYAFTLDEGGAPVELGSGRFAKAYLGEERWVESKTTYRRPVCIKVLQQGVSQEAQLRFQLEKEILERVQGHGNIIELLASGEGDNPEFVPPLLRDRLHNDYLVLELLDLSLEELLKGSRSKRRRDDLLVLTPEERIFRVLDYILPVAIAVEYAHLVCDTCHRDIKPANILLRLPDPNLRGSSLQVKLADFNVGKAIEEEQDVSMTRFHSVPGTLFFQSPEQETNTFELLVNVTSGSAEVEFFEDFYIDICENDQFQLFNRDAAYPIVSADRARKKIMLGTPYQEASETNVRAKVIKAVGRPADIYSLGAVFYYLVSGAYANPKTLFDAFHKFIEYETADESNNVAAYIEHEYQMIDSIRRPPTTEEGVELKPEHRFFSYKHYLDGNGELIDKRLMMIIAKAMIRNKPDSYCQAWDLKTPGISELVADLVALYQLYGVDPACRFYRGGDSLMRRQAHPLRRAWDRVTGAERRKRRATTTHKPSS